ncbi:MAG: hypothetical protein LBE01_05490 [Deltaproteobacteria bacterium]|jgi:hypothetical protein|nr:hypothetical protein [Deltaproteobacteria bacterium]
MPLKTTLGKAMAIVLATIAFLSFQPAAMAEEAECQESCATGRAKLVAEKTKNQKRYEAQLQLKEAGRAAIRDCFSVIYSQSFSIAGFPNLPDLSEALKELCRSVERSFSIQDYSLPQPTLKDILK